MTIAQCYPDSFKLELSQAVHNFSTDTLYIALYSSSASLGPQTTVYTSTGEISGTGYVAGGIALTGITQTTSNNVVFYTFANPTWPSATFTARGALIYNFSKSNKAVAVLDFGADKTTAGNTFTVVLPANLYNTALIRIS